MYSSGVLGKTIPAVLRPSITRLIRMPSLYFSPSGVAMPI